MIDQHTDKREGDRVELLIDTMTSGQKGRKGTVQKGFAGLLGVHWDDEPDPTMITIQLNGEYAVNLCAKIDSR